MIEGYIGRPGAGKSYTLTARLLDEVERGRDVFANYHLNVEGVTYFGPDDLLDLPPGLIVIDEAHLWFPARQALNLPPSWLAGLSQTRKKGWGLIWAAQHENRVDRVVRDVTSWMYLCSAWWNWDSHAVLFKSETYEPERFRQRQHRMGVRWRLFSRRVADAYNTYETLEVAAHTQRKSDRYAKGAG